MSSNLDGKSVLITGAGRGLGRAIAVRISRHAATVHLVARTGEDLRKTQRLASEHGAIVRLHVLDLSDRVSAENFADTVSGTVSVDVLINNAATSMPLGPSLSLTLEDWQRAIQLNLLTPILLESRLAPAMVDRGWGRIVTVSSGVVDNPRRIAGGNIYVTTKAALEAHTLNLGAELDGSEVTANIYRPGMVDTDMYRHMRGSPEIGEQLREHLSTAEEGGLLTTATDSADALVARLSGDAGTSQIWDIADGSVPAERATPPAG